MATGLAHLMVHIDPRNVEFYRDLFRFLGWDTIYEEEGMLGVAAGGDPSLWFVPAMTEGQNDYDAPGVNHIAIGAASIGEVDRTAAYLGERGIPALFETPRHRPEFTESPEETYYQVMFESPDRLLLEVVYTGPKEA